MANENPNITLPQASIIVANVRDALAEDIGSGDITAQLIAADTTYSATVISREAAVFCGKAWAQETFDQVDGALETEWLVNDGDRLAAGQTLFEIRGSARSILTAERTALNFLQLLMATATRSTGYAEQIKGLGVTVLDTRKTIPCLRQAQKYAVRCGGCANHRLGLYDAYLIKENHIAACGSIAAAIKTARDNEPSKTVEIEVESLDELQQALDAGADTVMLDNFSIAELKQAVSITNGSAKLEASGNIDSKGLAAIAATGVDYVSIGALTKHVQAIDLSMRFNTD